MIGSTRACSGASHGGRSPAKCSSITPKKRSSEPRMARWIITGRREEPAESM